MRSCGPWGSCRGNPVRNHGDCAPMASRGAAAALEHATISEATSLAQRRVKFVLSPAGNVMHMQHDRHAEQAGERGFWEDVVGVGMDEDWASTPDLTSKRAEISRNPHDPSQKAWWLPHSPKAVPDRAINASKSRAGRLDHGLTLSDGIQASSPNRPGRRMAGTDGLRLRPRRDLHRPEQKGRRSLSTCPFSRPEDHPPSAKVSRASRSISVMRDSHVRD